MSERGYIQLLDSDGEEIYAEFTIDSQEVVRVTLTKEIDGTETALDVSSATLVVHFYGSLKSAATVDVDTILTDVTDGSDGKVSGTVVFRRTDFSAAAVTAAGGVECAIVVVDTAVADTNTESQKKETIWKGRWKAKLREPMNEAVA